MQIRRSLQVLTLASAVALTACDNERWLTTTSPTIISDEALWSNPLLINGVLANFYGGVGDFMRFGNDAIPFTRFEESMYCGSTNTEGSNQTATFGFGTMTTWDYGTVWNYNRAIEAITASNAPAVTALLKERYIAELRFLRAYHYFEMVKRMGGVPIITEVLNYDFSGDPSYLRRARNTEAEVYDFIASELDAIVDQLGNQGSTTRANRYTALALKSRAMLYAGSVARFNSEMAAPISTPGGEVGIPASRAAEYFQKSLEASRAILNSGAYSLYQANANRGENFYEALTVKAGNPEMIWVRDYLASGGSSHYWTLSVNPHSLRKDVSGFNQGGQVCPTLQFVENFDYLNNNPGTLAGVGNGTVASQANWIFYDTPQAIFANKDARLFGTVIYPGTSVRGFGDIRLQAGVYTWNGTNYVRTEGVVGTTHSDGGVLTAIDGPVRSPVGYVTATGFNVRKFLDPNGGSSTLGSDVSWPRFRLGEIYMNATEAAFELNLQTEALGYINTLRQRAGFPANSLTSLTRDRIRRDRWSELSFENHHLFDMMRWRTAHIYMDGDVNGATARAHGLFGYRVIRPGHPDHGKFVYDRVAPATRQTQPRFWREGNYYGEIGSGVLSNNPLLVKNPFH